MLGIGALGCTSRGSSRPAGRTERTNATGTEASCQDTHAPAYAPTPVVRERDGLFMLLAYAIAYDAWSRSGAPARGADIAAVLADRDGRPLCWARNAVAFEDDATQHAEVRLLTSYLRHNPGTHADRLRLYATLEPCAMCAGMTLMTGVDTVLYGEPAGASGRVYDRLAYDGHAHGGHCPYPFTVTVARVPGGFVEPLAEARRRVADTGDSRSSEAREAVHAAAAHTLDTIVVTHPENVPVLEAIREYRSQIPREEPHAPYRIGCPSFETEPR